MKGLKIVFLLYLLTIVSLFLYSFTQIDLSLVISQSTFVQNLQKSFQFIGYFNRPLSTAIYLSIMLALFLGYVFFLRLTLLGKITKKQVWFLILTSTVILTFSYNAFSYDLFNYIFDAKIFTFYNQNPYLHKALDYPGDPMLSFMRWTHRVYPYGPVWLGLTIPLSYLGFKSFITTFFLFKLLMGISFIGTVYMIGKIFKKFSAKDELFGLIFFALNPLILIEGLVSAHVDIVMMFFAVTALYFLMQKRFVVSWASLFLSIGIKFATIFLLPIFIIKSFMDKKGEEVTSWDNMFYLSTILMSLAIVAASIQSGNFQPWYLFYFLTFATFVSKRPVIFITALLGSLIGVLNYVPYLFLGVWDQSVPQLVNTINMLGLSIIVVSLVIFLITRPKRVT